MGVVKRGTGTEFHVVEIAGEDDYDFQEYSLAGLRSDVALDVEGSSLTVYELTGTCELKLNLNTKPAIPLAALIYPSMIVFDLQFENVYLSNIAQAGKILRLYIGKR